MVADFRFIHQHFYVVKARSRTLQYRLWAKNLWEVTDRCSKHIVKSIVTAKGGRCNKETGLISPCPSKDAA